MAKQIIFSYGGVDYTLEFTRRTVRQMESEGFDVTMVDSRPMTLLPRLFEGAFKANHRKVKRDTIEAIFQSMPDKENLLNKLAEMYAEPLETLLDEPEDEEKNVEWVTSW